MGLADRLKGLTKKAEATAADHKDQIRQAVQKAEATADQRTGSKYHDQIENAGAKVDTFVDRIKEPETPPKAAETGAGESTPPAS
jgi:ABC-type transporter Mla subunit MlaD